MCVCSRARLHIPLFSLSQFNVDSETWSFCSISINLGVYPTSRTSTKMLDLLYQSIVARRGRERVFITGHLNMCFPVLSRSVQVRPPDGKISSGSWVTLGALSGFCEEDQPGWGNVTGHFCVWKHLGSCCFGGGSRQDRR